MLKKIYYKYILVILSAVLFTHVAFSYLLAKTVTFLYKNFLPNVRNFVVDRPSEMANAYLADHIKSVQRPVMLILGSSFSYGYSLKTNETYSHYLTQYFPKYNIANASIIGDSGVRAIKIMHQLKQKKLQVDTLIIELNLFNFTSSDFQPDDMVALPSKTILGLDSNNSFFEFFLLRPPGASALGKLDLSRIYLLGNGAEQKYNFVPLPDTYSKSYAEFEKNLSMYTSFLKAMLSIATEIADNVYFFVAPIYGKGMLQTQFKLTDIKKQIAAINNICTEVGRVHCLNPGLEFSEENFLNVSHASQQGHQTLADWLAQKIDRIKLV